MVTVHPDTADPAAKAEIVDDVAAKSKFISWIDKMKLPNACLGECEVWRDDDDEAERRTIPEIVLHCPKQVWWAALVWALLRREILMCRLAWNFELVFETPTRDGVGVLELDLFMLDSRRMILIQKTSTRYCIVLPLTCRICGFEHVLRHAFFWPQSRTTDGVLTSERANWPGKLISDVVNVNSRRVS